MDSETRTKNYNFDSKTPPKPEYQNAADATGLWFAAVVLCAFLAAGVIVYRTANSDFRVASNDAGSAAAQVDQGAQPPTALTH